MLENDVRASRIRFGWSQEELAGRSGVSRAGISAIETGRLVPSTAAALAVAAAMGTTVEALFRLPGTRPRAEGEEWAWPPHELPRLARGLGRLRGGCFWLELWTTRTIPPGPQYREPMPEDELSRRCAWPQACRAMATASIDSPRAWAVD